MCVKIILQLGENMKEVIQYQTHGTCCKLMNIELEDDTVKDVEFLGGCNGNLKGIRKLIIGMKINDIVQKLEGITCGSKSTSCPDQLAVCLKEYIKQKTSV